MIIINSNEEFYFDSLTSAGIMQYIEEKQRFKITVLDFTESTNSYLKKEALRGAEEGTVIIARHQTCGKGRFERKFHSPENCGIYMSILLKPRLSINDSIFLTAAAAVAVSEAIEELTPKKAKIKWVNDILIDHKKVCGILTEGSIDTKTAAFNWVVLGIGINTYTPSGGFELEIKDIAGAVFEKAEENLKNRLAAGVINRFMHYYKNLSDTDFITAYRERCAVLGKQITVIKAEKHIPATALDIDGKCRLLVEYGNGDTEYLSSGEISIKL